MSILGNEFLVHQSAFLSQDRPNLPLSKIAYYMCKHMVRSIDESSSL